MRKSGEAGRRHVAARKHGGASLGHATHHVTSQGVLVEDLELHGVDFQLGGLAQEVHADENAPHAVPPQDDALESDQTASGDTTPASFFESRVEVDGFVTFDDALNMPKVGPEPLLVRDLEDIGHAFRLQRRFAILEPATEEHVSGEQRDSDLHGAAAIGAPASSEGQEVSDSKAGQGTGDDFFVSRFRVQDPPPPVERVHVGRRAGT